MKKNLTNEEIVEKLQDHAINCIKIDELVAHIAPEEYDPLRTAGDTLFGQGARAIQKLESDITWNTEHILELKGIRIELGLDALYQQAKAERLSEENAKLLKFNKFLTNEINQLANFNPDWDVLMANRESLREHMVLIRKVWKMANEMEVEANDLGTQERFDAAAQLDHWSGKIMDALEDEEDN